MFITIDRYQADWAMVERGWKTHVLAQGPQFASASAAVKALRLAKPGVIDQDLPAFVVARGGRAFASFVGEVPFEREKVDVCFNGMMTCDGNIHLPPRILVEPPLIDRVLSE